MKYDVYSYGMISSSTLHVIENNFPGPDGYAEIKESYRMIGGEAANSSIVLSKFGLKIKLDGNWLGANDEGSVTKSILEKYGIDVSRLTLRENYIGVKEIVFTDGATRTNFGTYRKLLFTDQQWNEPISEDIQNAKIVCLDPFFKTASLIVSRICRELNKPYVSIDFDPEIELSRNAAVMIISNEFRQREYPGVTAEDLFQKYTRVSKGLIIFTAGGSEILYGRNNEAIKRFRPYQITPVDTAGGGDSFRAGIIWGMLKGWSEEKTIDFACALAACVCISFPGVLNAPSYEEVARFIESRK